MVQKWLTSSDYIREEITQAEKKPYLEVNVKTKNLNIWTQSSCVWIKKKIWDMGNAEIDINTFKGKKCYLGMDLATIRDIAAYSICFIDDNNNYVLYQRFFMPSANIRERSAEDKVPYELWSQQGYITLCPGDTIDFEIIESYILDDKQKYEIVDISYDAWKAVEIVKHLTDAGLQMTPIRQGFAVGGLSEGTSLFEKAVYDNRIIHGGNPVLDWMMTCTEVETDGRDNYRPVKPNRNKNTKRIDGVVSSIMAVQSSVRNIDEGKSIYDTEDVLCL